MEAVLQSLPCHLIKDKNVDDLIQKIEELSNRKWCLYISEPYWASDEFELKYLIRDGSKEAVKEKLINKIIDVIYSYNPCDQLKVLKSFCRDMKHTGILRHRTKKLEGLRTFLLENIVIEDKDYEFDDKNRVYFMISCHRDFILDWFHRFRL